MVSPATCRARIVASERRAARSAPAASTTRPTLSTSWTVENRLNSVEYFRSPVLSTVFQSAVPGLNWLRSLFGLKFAFRRSRFACTSSAAPASPVTESQNAWNALQVQRSPP